MSNDDFFNEIVNPHGQDVKRRRRSRAERRRDQHHEEVSGRRASGRSSAPAGDRHQRRTHHTDEPPAPVGEQRPPRTPASPASAPAGDRPATGRRARRLQERQEQEAGAGRETTGTPASGLPPAGDHPATSRRARRLQERQEAEAGAGREVAEDPASDLFASEPPPRPRTRVEGARTRRLREQRQAQERARRKKRLRRRLVSVMVLVLVLSVVSVAGYQAFNFLHDTIPQEDMSDYEGAGDSADKVVVTLPAGAGGSQIGSILKEAGVVASVGAFVKAYNANSNASGIQSGTYTLRRGMSAAYAVASLLDPASRKDHTLTVTEGATKRQVKESLMRVGGFTDAQVEEAFADTAAIGLPAVAGGNVEGWLAPSTYDVTADATATELVKSMVSTTVSRLNALHVPAESYQTVLTKASIVEREVSSSDYYSQVARVIENRLADTGGETMGKLQMDSTTLYGLGRTGGIPTKAEIEDPSNAYNTHVYAGLPPSPIGSPGEKAISAVLNPQEGPWLYFVTVDLGTGKTLFAATYDEQVANSKKLDEYCEAHKDMCGSGQGTPPPSQGSDGDG